jgi:glycosyltransferase involved in cell wall biosynthesis
MQTPFFSIIIPTYNRAPTVSVAIESVLTQSFGDFEIIIIDDGSTDNTADVVKEYKDERISYYFQQNKERSASRNKGMQLAAGRYFCLLDSDDHFLPHHLEVLHHAIAADNYPVALYKTMMEYGDGSRPDDLSYAYYGSDRNSAITYVWNNGSQLICAAFHRDIGRSVAFPESYFWFEDVHWMISVVMQYPLRQVMASTTYYLKSESHSLSEGFERYLQNGEDCILDLERKHGDELKRILGRKCFEIKLSELYLGLVVKNAAKDRKIKVGCIYLLKAMRTSITPRLLLKYCYYSLKLLKASFT